MRALVSICVAALVVLGLSSCIGRYRGELAEQCEAGDDNDCLTLAFMLLKGQDGKRDAEGALGCFVRACELGNPIGCKRAGDMWEAGTHGLRDEAKAKEYHRRAWELDRSPRRPSGL